MSPSAIDVYALDKAGYQRLRSDLHESGSMKAKEKKNVKRAMARALADRKVSDKAISAVVDRLDFSERIRGVDPCIFGICWDFVTERPGLDQLIDEALSVGRLGEIRVFPFGIVDPDLFLVHIEQDFDEIPNVARVER